QDVLVAAKRYVAGPRLFRSERSLIMALQREVYKLEKALIQENYQSGLKGSPVELLFSYISEFSDAFPNWQREYGALNKFLLADRRRYWNTLSAREKWRLLANEGDPSGRGRAILRGYGIVIAIVLFIGLGQWLAEWFERLRDLVWG